MQLGLANTTVLVTGAASGIGWAVALGFAAEGASVIASDIQNESLQSLVTEAAARGLNIVGRPADVSNESEVQSLFQVTNPVEVVVHCAGITVFRTLTKTSNDDYRRVLETNVTGTFYCFRSAVQHMKETGKSGVIVAISSINSQSPLSTQAIYTGTKAFIDSMVRCLAIEVAPLGIRVNAIAPGAIDTPMNATLQGERKASLANRIPLKRIGTTEDVVGTALFLASPMAGYVTGTTIVVDGGYIAGR